MSAFGAESQLALGAMYGVGKGVALDYVQAYVWLSLAAVNLPSGNKRDNAVEVRDAVADQLSSEQIAHAQQIARDWRAK